MIDFKNPKVQQKIVDRYKKLNSPEEFFHIEGFETTILTPYSVERDWNWHYTPNLEIQLNTSFYSQVNVFELSPDEKNEIDKYNTLVVGIVKNKKDEVFDILHTSCNRINSIIVSDWRGEFSNYRYKAISNRVIILYSLE